MVDLQELARRMLADYDARTPGRLLAEPLDLTTVQAYALQAEIARLREERGEKVIGYKVGCTSRAIQAQLGVDEPIFGRLFDTGCFRSGTRLFLRSLRQSGGGGRGGGAAIQGFIRRVPIGR